MLDECLLFFSVLFDPLLAGMDVGGEAGDLSTSKSNDSLLRLSWAREQLCDVGEALQARKRELDSGFEALRRHEAALQAVSRAMEIERKELRDLGDLTIQERQASRKIIKRGQEKLREEADHLFRAAEERIFLAFGEKLTCLERTSLEYADGLVELQKENRELKDRILLMSEELAHERQIQSDTAAAAAELKRSMDAADAETSRWRKRVKVLEWKLNQQSSQRNHSMEESMNVSSAAGSKADSKPRGPPLLTSARRPMPASTASYSKLGVKQQLSLVCELVLRLSVRQVPAHILAHTNGGNASHSRVLPGLVQLLFHLKDAKLCEQVAAMSLLVESLRQTQLDQTNLIVSRVPAVLLGRGEARHLQSGFSFVTAAQPEVRALASMALLYTSKKQDEYILEALSSLSQLVVSSAEVRRLVISHGIAHVLPPLVTHKMAQVVCTSRQVLVALAMGDPEEALAFLHDCTVMPSPFMDLCLQAFGTNNPSASTVDDGTLEALSIVLERLCSVRNGLYVKCLETNDLRYHLERRAKRWQDLPSSPLVERNLQSILRALVQNDACQNHAVHTS
jgi:hypothetical protein